jgi:hypothetical protein
MKKNMLGIYQVPTGVKFLLSALVLLPVWVLLLLNSAIERATANHNKYVELIRNGVSNSAEKAVELVHLGSSTANHVHDLLAIRGPLVLSIILGVFIVIAMWTPVHRLQNEQPA